MNASDRKRAMAHKLQAKRKALQDKVRQRTVQAAAKVRRISPGRRQKGGGRWWLLAALLLLLLLLLRDCSSEASLLPPEAPLSTGTAQPAPSPVVPPPAPTGRVQQRDRPAYAGEPPDVLPWLGPFRMQVAARSPRLAACFVGVEQPGRLKWTASVEPVHGAVSEHALEPTLQSLELTQAQRTCVIGVLSDPPYRLAPDTRATPSRVSLVIEF